MSRLDECSLIGYDHQKSKKYFLSSDKASLITACSRCRSINYRVLSPPLYTEITRDEAMAILAMKAL